MKTTKFLGILISSILIFSCAPLKPVTIIKNSSAENYKYIYISPTNSLTSSSGATYGGQYYSSSKSVNPADVITGILTKEGFIRFPELKNELANQTLIVNYGESGRRNRGLGYTIEVTIQLVSAKTNELISSCSAEGQGETEADDIRQAIIRCLSSLLNKK
jgi:hypothetical protein